MLRTLTVLALAVYGLAILGATIAARSVGSERFELLVRSSDITGRARTVGFAINLHHTDQLDRYLGAVNELADLGFSSLELVTPAYQTNVKSEQVRVIPGRGYGPHRDQVLALLRHAGTRGMTRLLMPIVLLSDPGTDEWRGKIHPVNWNRWWRSYQDAIDHFVDIANEAGVEIFCIGSELLSTERHQERWIALIKHVRERYKGLLTYSTNWDHYQVPQFWRHLDLIGMNGYWDLTTTAKNPDKPEFDDIERRWRQIRQQILAQADAYERPIIFTEIGYPSLPWALKAPWNYVNAKGAKSNPKAQALGYRAFLSVWDDLLTGSPLPPSDSSAARFAGVYFYRWDPYQAGTPEDTGYGVGGKPALDLLKTFLARRRGKSLR